MKIWNSYSSEHSAALVMIGRFKTAEKATDFLCELEKLEVQIRKEIVDCETQERFPDEMLKLLISEKINYCYDLAPKDLNDFLMEYNKSVDEKDPRIVRFTSDDTGWAGLIKMLINAGAHVEIFSEHNEKETDAQ